MDVSTFLDNFKEINWNTVLIIIHVIGVALGVGGATVSDILFFTALKTKKISNERFNILITISKIIWTGLMILIFSGMLLFLLIYLERGSIPMLASPRWQAKLTWVTIIFANGLFFKFVVFSKLKQLVGKTLSIESIKSSLWYLASSGSISITTWYSIVTIVMLPRSFRVPYPLLMGLYIVVLIVGTLIARKLLKKIVAASTKK